MKSAAFAKTHEAKKNIRKMKRAVADLNSLGVSYNRDEYKQITNNLNAELVAGALDAIKMSTEQQWPADVLLERLRDIVK